MKQLCWCFGFWVCFCGWLTGNCYAEQKPVIQVIDSLKIDLSKMDSTICIDDRVVLSFDSDSVFACEWIDLETGKIISKEKILTVSPKTTHKYQVNLYYFTDELIENGDFEDVSKPEDQRIETDYRFVKTIRAGNGYNKGNELWDPGTYRIGKNPRTFHSLFYRISDHTTKKGNMMIVNGSDKGNVIVWKQRVEKKIEIGKLYAFSAWGVEVGRNNPAQFHFTVNGVQLGEENITLHDNGEKDAKWEQFYELWRADQTVAEICLVNLNTKADGNDFAIDDISFASMEKKTGTITVNVLPKVELGELKDVDVCEGKPILVNAKATGSDITGYVWKKDGQTLNNRTARLRIPEADLQHTGQYTCEVTGKCGTRQNDFRVDVREKLKAEKLQDTIWPCEESRVSFSAGVTGYQPDYKWIAPVNSRGWEDDGAGHYVNDRIYWYRDTGTYLCRAENKCNDVTIYRTLKGGQHLRITSSPDIQNICPGTTDTLSITTEPEAERIEWTGPAIQGRFSGRKLILSDIRPEDAGVYYCRATDTCGKSVVAPVTLKVRALASWLEVSKDTTVCQGGQAVFRAYTDAAEARYHWTGPDGFTAETAEIVIPQADARKAGTYRLTVTDICGEELEGEVTLSLWEEEEGLNISPGRQICRGEAVDLEVSGGKSYMTYDWEVPGGKHYPGSSLHLPVGIAGEYICRITGKCGTLIRTTTLENKESLQADAGTTAFRVCEGERVCFQPQVWKGKELSFHWSKEGRKLAETETYCIAGAGTADAGTYECRIHSACGDTIFEYTLHLKEKVQITGYIPERYVKPGEQVMLFVTASGEDLNYSWSTEGKTLPEEHNSRLEVRAKETEGVTEYLCQVSGCNTETALIRVYVRDYTALSKDTAVVLCPGQSYTFRAPENFEEGCDREVVQHWVYEGKDTLSAGTALTLAGYIADQAGEYVYTRESNCGRTQLHLQVGTAPQPQLTGIRCEASVAGDAGRPVVCAGTDVVLKAEVVAEGMVLYEWSKDGELLAGENGATLKLGNVLVRQAGTYTCRVISAVCGEDSRTIVLGVNKKPEFTAAAGEVLCPGQPAELRVEVEASTPSEFIWEGPTRKGWTAHSVDGYTAFYRNAAVEAETAGTYVCRISNVCGQKSLEIEVKVEQEPGTPDIARQDTVCPGTDVELHMLVGQAEVNYTWTLPDQQVAVGECLRVNGFSEADTGVYRYRVETRNGCFSREGSIHLLLREEPAIPVVSPDTAVCAGNGVDLEAFSAGRDIRYEWWGPQGFHAEGQRIHISSVTEKNSGLYEVVVTDICNRPGRRNQVKVSVWQEFEGLVVSPDTNICEGSSAVLKVTGGISGLKYEWLLYDHVLSETAELQLPEAVPADAGIYICRIIGRCQRTEMPVNVKVFPRLKASQEAILPVCEREDTRLRVTATGERLSYKWMKEDREIGYRTAELELKDVIPSDAGIYECRVSSLCGDTLLSYEFRLKENTRITHHSMDRILCEDDDYDLMVEATGENNVYYWTCNGKALQEKGQLLHCPAAGHTDTLVYSCRVEGDCGKDSVSVRICIGEFRKLREDRADVLCEGSNYKYNADVVPTGTFESQGFNYEWTFGGKVVSSISLLAFEAVKPEDAGDYYCRITTLPDAPLQSEATVKLSVEVTKLPRLEAMSEDIYAIEGTRDSIRIKVSGDDLEYAWSKDGVETSHTEAGWDFVPIAYDDRGEYRVTVSNGCGHVSGATRVEVWRKTVIVFPQERDDSVCLKDDKQLEVLAWGESGLLYHWYLDGQAVDAPLTQPLELTEVREEEAGTYVCVVSGRGGTDSCKIHLRVLSLPELSLSGKFALCRDDSELLQKYVAGSDEEWVDYRWSVTGGEARSGMNTETAMICWDKEAEGELGIRVVSLTSGCFRDTLAKMAWNDLPEVQLVVPAEVGYCRDSLILDRAYPWGGDFYVNGQLEDVIHFADKSGFYAVTYQYTDARTGCRGTGYDTVRVADAPLLRLAEESIQSGWCIPVTLEISEHSEGEITWTGDRPLNTGNVYQAVFQPEAYTEDKLHFQAMLTDRYSCRAVDSVLVRLEPSPRVELMPDTTIGECNELVLMGHYDLVSPVRVRWEPADDLNVLEPGRAELLDKTPGTSRFVLAVTDSYGCVGRDTVKVEVVELPELEARELCTGDSLWVDASGYTAFRWSDGWPEAGRWLKTTGDYSLEVEDRFNCATATTFRVHPLPVVVLPDTLIFEGQEMVYTLFPEGAYGPYEVEWQNGSGGNSYTATEEGYYSATVSDAIGCQGADTVFLEVRERYIAAPDAFLPNSNGENSRFYLKEVNFVDRFEMYIYDRWGELLFKTNEIGFNGGWDGMFKGMVCQPGAYVWVAYANGKEIGRGTVMLVK